MEEQGQVQTYQDIMDACGSLESYFNPSNFNQQAEFLEELYGNNAKEKQQSLWFSDTYSHQNQNLSTTSKPALMHVFDFNDLEPFTERTEKQMNTMNVGQMYIQNLQAQKESELAKTYLEKEKKENQEIISERQEEKLRDQLSKVIQNTLQYNNNMGALSLDDNDQRRSLGEIDNNNNNIENTTDNNSIYIRRLNGINSSNHLKYLQNINNIIPNSQCRFRQITPPPPPPLTDQETNPKPQLTNNQTKNEWKVLEGQWRVHRDNRKRNSMSSFAQTMKQSSEYMREQSLFKEDSISKISQNLGSHHSNISQQVNKLSSQTQPYLPISKATYIEEQKSTELRSTKNNYYSSSLVSRPQSSLWNIKRTNEEKSDELATQIRFQLIDHSKTNKNNIINFKKSSTGNSNNKNNNDQNSSNSNSNNGKLVFSNFRLDLSRNHQNNQNSNSQAVVNNLVLFQTPYFNHQSKDAANGNTTTTITTASRFQSLLQQQKQQQIHQQPSQPDGNTKILQQQPQLKPPSTTLNRKSRAFERIVLSYHENHNSVSTKEYFPSYSQSQSDRLEQFKNCSIRQTEKQMNNETSIKDTQQLIEMPNRNQGSFKTFSLVNQMKS